MSAVVSLKNVWRCAGTIRRIRWVDAGAHQAYIVDALAPEMTECTLITLLSHEMTPHAYLVAGSIARLSIITRLPFATITVSFCCTA